MLISPFSHLGPHRWGLEELILLLCLLVFYSFLLFFKKTKKSAFINSHFSFMVYFIFFVSLCFSMAIPIIYRNKVYADCMAQAPIIHQTFNDLHDKYPKIRVMTMEELKYQCEQEKNSLCKKSLICDLKMFYGILKSIR